MAVVNLNEKLGTFLNEVVTLNATDLHISAGHPPILRLNGSLRLLNGKYPVLSEQDCEELAMSLLNEDQKDKLRVNRDIDLSVNFGDKARFRVNIYKQLGRTNIAMRYIPSNIRTIEQLHLPPVLQYFTRSNQGFFLVVGPAGHGKSTALAALINDINHTKFDHIITIEDPVEYIFKEDKCVIDQREVGVDVPDFHRGLRSALRQDPDVILIGEMRDPETISSAVTAAETGHLVFATLHTNTASQTIDRIIDIFPPHQQIQIRSQLASTLLGILSRRLIPTKDGKDLINAVEVMIANTAVRNLIREHKVYQLDMVIETSTDEGMISLNHSLADLVNKGLVDRNVAFENSTNPAELRILLS